MREKRFLLQPHEKRPQTFSKVQDVYINISGSAFELFQFLESESEILESILKSCVFLSILEPCSSASIGKFLVNGSLINQTFDLDLLKLKPASCYHLGKSTGTYYQTNSSIILPEDWDFVS